MRGGYVVEKKKLLRNNEMIQKVTDHRSRDLSKKSIALFTENDDVEEFAVDCIGFQIYQTIEKLFPICRSITGNGTRKTLKMLKNLVPELQIHEVPTGTDVFDWTVPKEWNIRDAYIEDLKGNKIISFQENNLHVVGYSAPMDKVIKREELFEIVHTLPEQPDLIPYITSYYKEYSGFCMSEYQKSQLTEDYYHVCIDSDLKDGALSYGEILIPGKNLEEIFISTYICHPSMANDELSGPGLVIYLAKWLQSLDLNYSYRIIFVPETIGSIAYLSQHLQEMKKKIMAGFNVACVGDDRTYSYIPSRYGNTLADKVAKNILSFHYPYYTVYTYLDRGSDERQYCAPGIDLPVCSICRSKHGEYPEYHTSGDNLNIISPSGLQGAFDLYKQCIEALENNFYYQVQCFGEPCLGKRGLYPTLSQKGKYGNARLIADFLAYSDGANDLIDISNILKTPVSSLIPIAEILLKNGLIKIV